jgi:hypothetical protein
LHYAGHLLRDLGLFGAAPFPAGALAIAAGPLAT